MGLSAGRVGPGRVQLRGAGARLRQPRFGRAGTCLRDGSRAATDPECRHDAPGVGARSCRVDSRHASAPRRDGTRKTPPPCSAASGSTSRSRQAPIRGTSASWPAIRRMPTMPARTRGTNHTSCATWRAFIPARWRVPVLPVSEPGRHCALFAMLCKLALKCSDEELLTWARSLNRTFSPPLPEPDARSTWASVCRYRARWRAQGHKPEWRARQAARARNARAASLFDDLSNEQSKPWDAAGVSRRTWYRLRARAKTAGESLGAKVALSQYR